MRAILLSAAIALAGCASGMVPISTNPAMKKVEVDGKEIMVAPHPDGTWGATESAAPPLRLKNPATTQALYARAVEKASGCRVISAHYNQHGDDLTAVVSCK